MVWCPVPGSFAPIFTPSIKAIKKKGGVGYNLTAKGCDMRIYIPKICPDFNQQRNFLRKVTKIHVI
jgi:hypothetical protein